jgi:hypothetical protein
MNIPRLLQRSSLLSISATGWKGEEVERSSIALHISGRCMMANALSINMIQLHLKVSEG